MYVYTYTDINIYIHNIYTHQDVPDTGWTKPHQIHKMHVCVSFSRTTAQTYASTLSSPQYSKKHRTLWQLRSLLIPAHRKRMEKGRWESALCVPPPLKRNKLTADWNHGGENLALLELISNESWHNYIWVVSHARLSLVTHMNESCRKCEYVVSHGWVIHTTCRTNRVAKNHRIPYLYRSFSAKRATNYRARLRKMAYKDKASCDSETPSSPHWLLPAINLPLLPCVHESYMQRYKMYTIHASKHTTT